MNIRNFIILILLIPVTFAFAQPNNTAIDNNEEDQSEISIAIDPLDNDHLLAVWNDFRSGVYSDPGYGFSTDGGNTWSVDTLAKLDNFEFGFDPSAAFDRSGNAFYCYIASNGGLGAVFVSKTTDDGTNWDSTQVSSAATGQDKPFMALDNTNGTYDGRIYVSWTDFTGGTSRIKFSYSTDSGSNFSPEITLGSASGDPGSNAYLRPVDTTPGTPNANFVQGSMPAVGPDGELFVVWMEVNLSGNSYFKIRKSTNGGSSFASAVAADTFAWNRSGWGALDHLNLPTLAVDQDNGYVYLAYKEGSTPRIKFKRSTDGGSGWGEAPQVIANLGEKGEVFPWLAVDSDGKVAVTLMHRRDNNEVDCYVAESYDRGASFRSPVKVTDQSSDPSDATWTHHYMGMVLDDEGNNYVVWTDYRDGNADPYFAKLNTPPEAPQNLSPSVVGENENPRIDWDANEETDLNEYEVWKKEGDGTWNLLATTKNNYYVDILENNVTLSDCQGCTPIYYKLKAGDLANNKSGFSQTVTFNQRDGGEKISAGPSDPVAVPDEYVLLQNYPNPFNPTTAIQFAIPEAQEVEVAVYNLTGQKIATLAKGFMEEGIHHVEWNGTDAQGNPVSSGVYIYQLKAGKQRMVKKMLLAK